MDAPVKGNAANPEKAKALQAALAQISGLDAASDVVAEAVNDYNAEK